MKKLALALVASTVAIGATNANISTGFYLGAAVGYGSTTGKYSVQGNNGSLNIGGNAANIGIMGGYGWLSGCLYLGGEVAYTFENAKIDAITGSNPVTLKRNGYFNAALRGGYLFTPNTMMYVRLGANIGKWTLNDANNRGFQTNRGTGSKSRLSFAPGVGLETAVHKNVYLRVEYVYEFGPSVTATNSSVANTTSTVGTLRNQSGKVGLAYKF